MCAIAGVMMFHDFEKTAELQYWLLYHLQHRGPDSAGIVVRRSDGTYKVHRGSGTIDTVFYNQDFRSSVWHGAQAIGHARYTTSGSTDQRATKRKTPAAAQPIKGIFRGEPFWMAFNGNLSPACYAELVERVGRHHASEEGSSSISDTELMVKDIEKTPEDTFEDALYSVSSYWRGAFSLIFLYRDCMLALRDQFGFRPMEFGKNKFGYILASEDNVFDVTKFPQSEKLFSIKPGQFLRIKRNGTNDITVELLDWFTNKESAFCAFEYVYFSRFDSTLGEVRVALLRKELGRQLAREQPPPPGMDFVVDVPDSGRHAAEGYAEEAHLPFTASAIQRLHGAGRSFLLPLKSLRKEAIENKLQVVPECVRGKRIIVVDDSIVRGNVAPRVVHLLKQAGAEEVHFRVASPPIRHGCRYGIDTYRIEHELIARRFPTVPDIIQEINRETSERYGAYTLDSLEYLSLEGMKQVWRGKEQLCTACWTGNYPVN